MKSREKSESIKLRKLGKSYKEIAEIIQVSPASVHRWCKKVYLTQRQKKQLIKNSFVALQKGRKKAIEKQKVVRKLKYLKLKKRCRAQIGKISNREKFLIGVGLYWAEGFKKDSRAGFANSDPDMIKFFLSWLVKNCGVSRTKIRLRVGLNISHKKRVRKIENYWSEITQIPLSQFQKPFFQKTRWKKHFTDKANYFGVLRIRINQEPFLLKKILYWIDRFKNV
jgi:transposase